MSRPNADEVELLEQQAHELGEIQGVQWAANQIMDRATAAFRSGSDYANLLRTVSETFTAHATNLRAAYDKKHWPDGIPG